MYVSVFSRLCDCGYFNVSEGNRPDEFLLNFGTVTIVVEEKHLRELVDMIYSCLVKKEGNNETD